MAEQNVTPAQMPPESEKKRPKAYSYVRFSSKKQADGDSLRRQLDASRKYARQHRLDLQEDSYQDLGVSAYDGSNISEGGQLRSFIQAVESGAVEQGSYLLVESLDRISRADVLDAANVLTDLVKSGIKVVTFSDKRVWDEHTIKQWDNVLLAVLIFARANEESEKKSERVREANDEARARQDPLAFSNAPGWLKKGETKWEKDHAKVRSVRKVFVLSARGFGATHIARRANEEGWPVPGRAAKWHKTLPAKLIRNRRVLGELFPEKVIENGKRVPTGHEWLNYYPRIVSETVFYLANVGADQRRKIKLNVGPGRHNVFQGLIKCGHCGATLARKRKVSSKKNSDGYAIYVCSDRDRGVSKCPNWNARDLEEVLVPTVMTFVVEKAMAGTARRKIFDDLEKATLALKEVSKRYANLYGIVENWDAPEDWREVMPDVGKQMISLATRRKELTTEIEELKAKATDPLLPAPWEKDLEKEIEEAMLAVADITNARKGKREELHRAFLRHVREIKVWPKSHAHLLLNDSDELKFLPLSEEGIAAAMERRLGGE